LLTWVGTAVIDWYTDESISCCVCRARSTGSSGTRGHYIDASYSCVTGETVLATVSVFSTEVTGVSFRAGAPNNLIVLVAGVNADIIRTTSAVFTSAELYWYIENSAGPF